MKASSLPVCEDESELPGAAREGLRHALEGLAENESRFSERFYEVFFERRPDTLPLFGVHSIPEREEMIRETLHSLLALCDGEAWLEGNLVALGQSHAEYGVLADMYESYCDVFVDCGREILGERTGDREAQALRLGIEIVARVMRDAGESKSG